MNSFFKRTSFFLGMLLISGVVIFGNILRHKDNFYMALDKVHENKRMLNEYVLEIFSKITLHDCLVNCILSPPCEAINIHMDGATCETLRSSTLITKDILIGAPGWTFYEIDPAKRDNGHYCEDFSPCPDTHICDDTYDDATLYTCRCEENFQGETCDEYIGPGSNKSVPAGSCQLIKEKHVKIRNGYFWIKSGGNNGDSVGKEFCEMSEGVGIGLVEKAAVPTCDWLRRKYPTYPTRKYWIFKTDQEEVYENECNMIWDRAVDGGWGKWSIYSECSQTCGSGSKNRTRLCNDPTPAFGGARCSDKKGDKMDNETETLACNVNKCCIPVRYDVGAQGANLFVFKNVKYWMACYYKCKSKGYKVFGFGKSNSLCNCKNTYTPFKRTGLISNTIEESVCGAIAIKYGTNGELNTCQEHEKINVEFAIYKVRYGDSCDEKFDATSIIKKHCDGKQFCQYTPTAQKMNGGVDICSGYNKYLYIQYLCEV